MRIGPLRDVFALFSGISIREPEVDALEDSCILNLIANLRKFGEVPNSFRWIRNGSIRGHNAEFHLVGVEVKREGPKC